MPQPVSSSSIQRPDLGSLAWEYMTDQEKQGFIGQKIMLPFLTPKYMGHYPIIPIEALLNLRDTARASGSEYNRDTFEFGDGTYSTKDHGLEAMLDDDQKGMYRNLFDLEAVETIRLSGDILRAQERRIAVIVQNTANAVGNAAVSTIWSTLATANPGKDIYLAKEAMRVAGGLYPNVVAMTQKAFDNAIQTEAFLERTKYTATALALKGQEAQRMMVAAWFGVDDILIADGLQNNAKKGQNASLGRIWDNSKINLLHIGSNANDLKEPTFGRTFIWSEQGDVESIVEIYREEARRADVLRVRNHTDEAVVSVAANYILTGAV